MYNLYTLKNGLRIVTEKNDSVRSISVGIMVQNGSRNETKELNGISHFIEHMFFKGTNKRSPKEIAASVENLGGQINAFTSKETTCYYVKNLNTHLELSLEILSDIILNSKFAPEDIEREKGVVIEEINMSEDNPEDALDDLHSKIAFGDHSLSYPILGTIEKVKSFNKDIIKEFIKRKYTPYNSVLSICGNFNDDELKLLVEKYFGIWENENLYVPTYEGASIYKGTASIDKDIEQLHIGLGLKGLPYGDERGYALVLLSNIFGGGASSTLFQKVREELGLCYNIYCYPQAFQGVGMLNIYTGLSKNYAEKALDVIIKELYKFSKMSITKEVLEMNKEKIKGNYILGLESTSSRMFSNAKSVLFKNKISTQDEVIKRIDKVSIDDIDFVLKECFGNGIINSSYVGSNVDYSLLDNVIESSVKAYKDYTEDIQV
ncbi:insulinase family protein [Clostridium sp. SHJSY1]|uniref:M16 family metallopeptidase n=1 Tax=Clostridium sp. SHJSY1 TaxID=2942483 RepID=UPI002876BFEB|nr:pitrilysin family protein [Clostridium sp. SHJSY1]MDS0524880.1 insulinase family protein [Clostridium sp. SHJSY1]